MDYRDRSRTHCTTSAPNLRNTGYPNDGTGLVTVSLPALAARLKSFCLWAESYACDPLAARQYFLPITVIRGHTVGILRAAKGLLSEQMESGGTRCP